MASECDAGEIVGIENARTDTDSFSSIDGCLNSAFLGLFETSCGPSFSGHGYPTQCAANICCPRSDRFWLLELRVSRHFSTFYGPSVQAMDTQPGVLPTLILSSLGPFPAA